MVIVLHSYLLSFQSGVGNWPMYLAAENGYLDVMKLLYEVRN